MTRAWIWITGAVAAIIVGAGLWWCILRWRVGESVSRLRDARDRLADESTKARTRELSELGADFEAMDDQRISDSRATAAGIDPNGAMDRLRGRPRDPTTSVD